MHLHGNGFRVNLSENQRRYFAISTKGHGATTHHYLRGGSVAGGRMAANLGGLGKVRLRFVPVGESSPVPIVNWCSGPKGSWQPGYVVGLIPFRGEHGYTQVRVHRALPAFESWRRLRCHYLHGGGRRHSGESQAIVRASRHGGGAAVFSATRFYRRFRPAGRRVLFSASVRARVGRPRRSNAKCRSLPPRARSPSPARPTCRKR
jgi:hypothetical protein